MIIPCPKRFFNTLRQKPRLFRLYDRFVIEPFGRELRIEGAVITPEVLVDRALRVGPHETAVPFIVVDRVEVIPAGSDVDDRPVVPRSAAEPRDAHVLDAELVQKRARDRIERKAVAVPRLKPADGFLSPVRFVRSVDVVQILVNINVYYHKN